VRGIDELEPQLRAERRPVEIHAGRAVQSDHMSTRDVGLVGNSVEVQWTGGPAGGGLPHAASIRSEGASTSEASTGAPRRGVELTARRSGVRAGAT
jgi:hypothetical protein